MSEYKELLKEYEKITILINENPKDNSLKWQLFRLETKIELIELYGRKYE